MHYHIYSGNTQQHIHNNTNTTAQTQERGSEKWRA